MTGEQDRNTAGQTIAMTAVSDLKWWGHLWLPIVFWATGRFTRLTGTLRGLRFIHFAAWTIVGNRLLFISHYNGGRDEYVTEFAEDLTSGMRTFWSSSKGFPGPLPVGPFLDYIEAHESTATVFWSAYPDATTGDVVDALNRAGHEPIGRTRLFMTVLPPVAAEALERAIPAALEGAGAHFVRLVPVDKLGVLLVAVHDNDRDTFIDELLAAIPTHTAMTIPTSALLDGEIKPGLFYAAYDATVQQVQAALAKFPADDEWASEIPGERLHIERLQRFLIAKQGPERCQHHEEIGTVNAVLIPNPDRPNWTRHGVLERHGEVPCTVRYSLQDGIVGAAVMFDRADTSDLVLAGGRAFFWSTPEQVLRAQEKRAAHGTAGFALSFLPGLNPRRWQLRGLHNALTARRAYPWQRKIRNPVDAELCSLVAFDHGGTIVRWLLRPAGAPVGADQGDSLRAALAASVAQSAVVLEVCAQVRTDPARMPVEDPTVRWDEKASPFVAVAQLVLLGGQTPFDGSGLRVRLLGGQGSIGRARREVYPALQEIRLPESAP